MKFSLRAKLVAPLAALVLLAPGIAYPQTAAAAVDVYITEGTHQVNGRTWYTDCEPYSSTVTRCRTDIDATQVTYEGGRFVTRHGRVFNNLTYVASPRANWANNNLGKNAYWVSPEGREWATDCDTPETGYNGCRSWIWSSYVTRTQTGSGWKYEQVNGWVFNNMVRFSTSHYAQYSGSGSTVITLPAGASELYVQGSHKGSGNFVVWGLDAGNAETDLAINEIGPSRASGAIGIHDDDTVKLEVTANGSWSITVSPLSAAPKLTAQGSSGTGGSVLWYYGAPRTFTVSSRGDGYVGMWQWGSEDSKLLVNEIGPYSGQVAFLAGPSVIEIDADADWAIN